MGIQTPITFPEISELKVRNLILHWLVCIPTIQIKGATVETTSYLELTCTFT